MNNQSGRIHLPREVWACIMSYNNQSRQIKNLQKSLEASNEFGDIVTENLDRATRIQETLFFQLRRLQGRLTRLRRRNQVLMATIQRERGAPMIATAYDSLESSDTDSEIIDVTSDNEITV
jgi:hypothetical protein